jgi:alcohol dehydrogenase, propanol-preferring
MKVAVVNRFFNQLELKEMSAPLIGSGEVLIRIHDCCGGCHIGCHSTACVTASSNRPSPQYMGIVCGIGKGVSSLAVGDRVGLPCFHSACGECGYCRSGKERMCEHQLEDSEAVFGDGVDYGVFPASHVVKIPGNLHFQEAAPIFCKGVLIYKALKESRVKQGEWVAVFGMAGQGHLAVQYAKAMGLRVVAVDERRENRELAKKSGADMILDTEDTDPVAVIMQKIGGVHASLCLDIRKNPFRQSYLVVRRGGTVALVWSPHEELKVPQFDKVLFGIRIKGSIVGTRKDVKEALDFVAGGKVKACLRRLSIG